jgi:serine/threonine-protein kinase
MLAHLHDEPPRPTAVAEGIPSGFDRVIARALAKDPEKRYLSAGDLGRATLAAAEGRHVTEVERTVARGAAAPQERESDGRTAVLADDDARTAVLPADRNGHTAATVADAPPRPKRTEHQPADTMLLGDRPRRRRGRRAGGVLAALVAAGLATLAVVQLADGGGVDAATLPGAPVSDGEVEQLVTEFSDAYAKEDAAKLGRLLSRDAERVVPGARQEGRTDVVRSYKRQFSDSDTRSFEVQDLSATGGATGRASGRYVATYAGEPDVTGTITFGVLRDRGTPRIALIVAHQDSPARP